MSLPKYIKHSKTHTKFAIFNRFSKVEDRIRDNSCSKDFDHCPKKSSATHIAVTNL